MKLCSIIIISTFIFHTNCIAQFSISGKITDSINNVPLAGVTVFLNNATKGTSTATDGSFVLSNIRPGQYDLVISMIGYEAFSTTILINNNKENFHIKLVRKATALRPVVILPDKVRQRYYEIFKRNFIGSSANAEQCRILNPELLYFDFEKSKNVLTATTDDFLVIENKALGYRIKFLLRIFTHSSYVSAPSLTYYEGQALFEELDGGKAKKNRWHKKRLEAYIGSSMHFFRSAAANKISSEGFIMHSLVRMPNKDRPTDDSIRKTLARLRSARTATDAKTQDSIDIWQRKFEIPATIQMLSRDTLATGTVIKRTDQPGVFALTCKNLLYLSNTKKRRTPAAGFLSEKGIDGAPFSVVTLQVDYAFFDSNGIILEPQSVTYEGYWADFGAIADLLPTDFEL